ncbi:MAG: hypothetical protein OEL84_09295 [Nitrosopumilus sp.]|nr:hypothetical protein [Nitrosopumilus sp.]MDH3341459.1 hypothetical protein [Nitrosopumilus sp.]
MMNPNAKTLHVWPKINRSSSAIKKKNRIIAEDKKNLWSRQS